MMELCINIGSLLSSFLIIVLSEFADKTQLAAFTLSCNFGFRIVFFAGTLAFLSVNLISLFFASSLSLFLPIFWGKLISAILFIVFGFLSFRDRSLFKCNNFSFTPFLTVFLMIFSMEFADKTNLAVFGLVLNGADLLSVLLGLTLSAVFLFFLASFMGSKLMDRFKLERFNFLSSLLFIFIGAWLLVGLLFLS